MYICTNKLSFINYHLSFKTVEETFRLKAYTKADLALLYSPHSGTATALQNLYRWMKRNQPLMNDLQAVGYNKYRHSFLKQEVGIIVKYLGEP